jgi:hypothetical protein
MTIEEQLEKKYGKREEGELKKDYIRRSVKKAEEIYGFVEAHQLLLKEFKKMGYRKNNLAVLCSYITKHEKQYAEALSRI